MPVTCSTCDHWKAGLCCRFPPAPVEWRRGFLFPETDEDMTCGEWKPKEPVATNGPIVVTKRVE